MSMLTSASIATTIQGLDCTVQKTVATGCAFSLQLLRDTGKTASLVHQPDAVSRVRVIGNGSTFCGSSVASGGSTPTSVDFLPGFVDRQFSSPAQKPVSELGGSAAGLVMIPLRPTRLFAFSTQFTSPAGWWVNGCDGDCIGRRGYRS